MGKITISLYTFQLIQILSCGLYVCLKKSNRILHSVFVCSGGRKFFPSALIFIKNELLITQPLPPLAG